VVELSKHERKCDFERRSQREESLTVEMQECRSGEIEKLKLVFQIDLNREF